jgi:N-acetylmuramoyl-L-alanine amidase
MRICLDAGHYGKRNQSPAVKEYYESVAMWDLHLLLKEELEKYGFTVVTTRKEQNKDCDLYARGACSKMSDLFLSLHSNAVGNGVDEKTDHISVYHLMDDDGTKCDEVSKAFAEKIAPVIAQVMGVKKGYKILTRKSSSDKNKDGVMNDNYYGVLHGARMVGTPGLILEHSFHTNTKATKWLLDEANLKKLAEAEAKCIAEFFGVEKEELNEETEDKKGVFTMEMRNLKKGCEGEDVRALQILLMGRGYKMKSGKKTYKDDGDFGTATENAVKAFQHDKGLKEDGIAGKDTMSALLGVNA